MNIVDLFESWLDKRDALAAELSKTTPSDRGLQDIQDEIDRIKKELNETFGRIEILSEYGPLGFE